ncbi:MAG: hypothetical protein EBV27_00680 [Actinobacteria bacterium]|jgi:hypothetical protein|nr:hypothetical protein [Actinomycetota bacterium]
MEYFLGSITTLILFLLISKAVFKDLPEDKPVSIRYSQSHIHSLMSPLLPKNIKFNNKKTQSMNHYNKHNLRVIMIENSAYWVKDNVFYMADLVSGEVNPETTRVVDTMGMDSVELDKMLFIMDRLREGLDNDSGGTGN